MAGVILEFTNDGARYRLVRDIGGDGRRRVSVERCRLDVMGKDSWTLTEQNHDDVAGALVGLAVHYAKNYD